MAVDKPRRVRCPWSSPPHPPPQPVRVLIRSTQSFTRLSLATQQPKSGRRRQTEDSKKKRKGRRGGSPSSPSAASSPSYQDQKSSLALGGKLCFFHHHRLILLRTLSFSFMQITLPTTDALGDQYWDRLTVPLPLPFPPTLGLPQGRFFGL